MGEGEGEGEGEVLWRMQERLGAERARNGQDARTSRS